MERFLLKYKCSAISFCATRTNENILRARWSCSYEHYKTLMVTIAGSNNCLHTLHEETTREHSQWNRVWRPTKSTQCERKLRSYFGILFNFNRLVRCEQIKHTFRVSTIELVSNEIFLLFARFRCERKNR